MQITIVPMDYPHIDEVYIISKENFTSEAFSKKLIEMEISSPTAVTFVAINGGNIFGFINASCILDECYINNIAVSDSHKNLGIGTALMDKMIEYCISNSFSFITLEVRSKNAKAIKFYIKFSFVNVGTRRNFYTNPTDDAILMTLNLNK